MAYEMYKMKNLFDQKNYDDAIAYARDDGNRAGFGEWDYLYLINCLYAKALYSKVVEMYREAKAKLGTTDKLNDKTAWAIYYLRIKPFLGNIGERKGAFLNAADEILAICGYGKYSPRNFIACLVLDNIYKKKLGAIVNYETALEYIKAVEVELLSDEEKIIQVDGRDMKSYSDLERFFNRRTKALLETNQYEACINSADEALKRVSRFHNRSDCWLNYYKAKSFLALNQEDQAEELCNSLLSRMQHWCFYEILFSIAEAKGNREEALRQGAICSSVDGEHKARVSFYEKFANFLLVGSEQEQRLAKLHLHLVQLIYLEEWNKEKSFDNVILGEDILALDKAQTLRELSGFWKAETEKGIEFLTGTIRKVLPNGKSGFIEAEGESYYFNLKDFTHRLRELREGSSVRFAVEMRLDKSKGVEKPNAVKISLIR